MAQQTAVDWLIEQLETFVTLDEELTWDKLFEQAKQMEKEQMIGLLKWMNDVAKDTPMRLETDNDDIVEQYYNETYNK